MEEEQRSKEVIIDDYKLLPTDENFKRILLEVLLDIRDNTIKPAFTKESISDKVKQMREMSEGLQSLMKAANMTTPL